MGILIAIEGLDGAGKNTTTTELKHYLVEKGYKTTQIAFPQYQHSIAAKLINQALMGQLDPLLEQTYAMSLLFALDRYTFKSQLINLLKLNDVVLVDRYIASNIAYSCAKMGKSINSEIANWIENLEIKRLELPKPNYQILLNVSPNTANERTINRNKLDKSRNIDRYEKDIELQKQTWKNYLELYRTNWLSEWISLDLSQTKNILNSKITQLVEKIFQPIKN